MTEKLTITHNAKTYTREEMLKWMAGCSNAGEWPPSDMEVVAYKPASVGTTECPNITYVLEIPSPKQDR